MPRSRRDSVSACRSAGVNPVRSLLPVQSIQGYRCTAHGAYRPEPRCNKNHALYKSRWVHRHVTGHMARLPAYIPPDTADTAHRSSAEIGGISAYNDNFSEQIEAVS